MQVQVVNLMVILVVLVVAVVMVPDWAEVVVELVVLEAIPVELVE